MSSTTIPTVCALLVLITVGLNAQDAPENSAGITETLHFEKILKPYQVMEQRTLVAGTVADVGVAVGDRIEAGQVLMRINDQKVVALIAGRIQDIVSAGTAVGEDTVVAVVVDDSILQVELVVGTDIIPRHMQFFREGQMIPLRLVEKDYSCSGEVKKGTDRVWIRVPDGHTVLEAGMRITFDLTVPIRTGGLDTPPPAEKPVLRQYPGNKWDFSVSFGATVSDPGEHYDRASGIDIMTGQYAEYYGIDRAASGELARTILYFPLAATGSYRLSDRWFLSAGLEYGFGSNSSQAGYSLQWPALVERLDYTLSSSMSYIMPMVGIEARFSSLALYTRVVVPVLSMTFDQQSDFNDGSLNYTRRDEISVSGTAVGLLLGVKYNLRLARPLTLFGRKAVIQVGLEGLYARVGSLSGQRITTFSGQAGSQTAETVDGTIYAFDTDPYGLGEYATWDLFASAPSGPGYSNVRPLAVTLSGIRLRIGLGF